MFKNIIAAIVTSILVSSLVLGLVGGNKTATTNQTLGGMTGYSGLTLTPQDTGDGLKVGSSGSTLSFVRAGTCNLVGGSIAATSSAPSDCAVTGVLDGDLVLVTLATSTANAVATGARASSTSGFITVRLLNLTGAASSVSALGSSTAYYIFRAL